MMSAISSPPPSKASEVGALTRRAERQLAEVRRMYIDGRPCMEVVEQLAAARASTDTMILGLLRARTEKRLTPIADGGGKESKECSSRSPATGKPPAPRLPRRSSSGLIERSKAMNNAPRRGFR